MSFQLVPSSVMNVTTTMSRSVESRRSCLKPKRQNTWKPVRQRKQLAENLTAKILFTGIYRLLDHAGTPQVQKRWTVGFSSAQSCLKREIPVTAKETKKENHATLETSLLVFWPWHYYILCHFCLLYVGWFRDVWIMTGYWCCIQWINITAIYKYSWN